LIRRDIVTEWQTKTLANFSAATVQVPKGKSNPLARAVDAITLVSHEDLKSIGASRMPEATNPKAFDPAVFVEQGSQVAKNPVASFERIAQGLRPR
jgi:hypothetical protein